MRLTDISIRKLRPTDKQSVVYDSSLSSFGIRVGKRTKTFIVKLGKTRSIKSIGRYPDISLAEARQEAMILLATGPGFHSDARYPDAVKRYLKECEAHNRLSTIKGYRHYLTSYDTNKRISDISRSDVQVHLERYKDKPSGYSHALTAFKIFFNWCLRKELTDRNPVAGEKAIIIPSRERVLLPEELVGLWAYDFHPFSAIIKLCLLTGQRRSEIAGIVPEWIKDSVLTFPSSFTKNKRRHSIPVSEQVLELLEGVPFGQNGNPWNGWSNGKRRIDKYVEIPHWTIHDLRRTFSTIHAEIGTPIHITERLLNHASGSTGGIVGVYNKYQYLDEMREAQEKYETVLMNIVTS